MKGLVTLKENIRNNFSDSVDYYNEYASLQMEIAKRLAKALEPWQYSIPNGPLLEIGSGTGFFTNHLTQMFKNRELIISDLSDDMIQFCREKYSDFTSVTFKTIDVELVDLPQSKYALIAGNYVAQWFKDPAQTLSKIAGSLKPGGLLLISFPASESFSNWRKYCIDLGLPYTGNSLPDLEKVVVNLSMGPYKVDYYEDDMNETFESAIDFFRHLKKMGASTNLNKKKLSVKQLNLLNDYWLKQEGGKIKVHYHNAFIAVKRDVE